MKKYLRLDEILSKTFIYSFIFLKMKILLTKPGKLPEISTRPTGLTLALASGRVLISNPAIVQRGDLNLGPVDYNFVPLTT